MLILLYGEDTFRSRGKLNEIIKEYQAKHKTGLNLIRFNENSLDFDKIKQSIGAVSMFDEKKLIILENILKNKDFQGEFFSYIKKNKLKDSQEIILVIYQEGKIDAAIKRRINLFEEFKPLEGLDLANWVKREIAKHKMNIDQMSLKKLVAYVGNDLWQMNSEIGKLISYKAGESINERDIDLLVKSKVDLNIFKTLDALAQKDKKTALRLLHEHISQGENENYLLSMFVYQLRTLIKLKDLVEKGTPFYSLAQKSGLHPYVVKKSSSQIRNFSLDQLKRIYQRLLEIDSGIKTGRIDGLTALDILVGEI